MTPIVWIFGSLMVAAISAAFAFALQLAENKRTLKRVEHDLIVTRSELSALNEKNDQEKTEIKAVADARINKLTETISNLQSQLKEKISDSHVDNLLDDTKVKLLMAIAKEGYTTDGLIKVLSLNPQVIKFHLHELEQKKMIREKRVSGGRSGIATHDFWTLMHDGRSYLIKNKLIS